MYSVYTKKAPKPAGSYSQGSSAARNVYVSGQFPIDPITNTTFNGTLKEQTQLAIDHIAAILEDVELTLQDICQATVYVTDLGFLEDIDSVWEENFEKPFPARTVVKVDELLYGSPLCIEAIALR